MPSQHFSGHVRVLNRGISRTIRRLKSREALLVWRNPSDKKIRARNASMRSRRLGEVVQEQVGWLLSNQFCLWLLCPKCYLANKISLYTVNFIQILWAVYQITSFQSKINSSFGIFDTWFLHCSLCQDIWMLRDLRSIQWRGLNIPYKLQFFINIPKLDSPICLSFPQISITIRRDNKEWSVLRITCWFREFENSNFLPLSPKMTICCRFVNTNPDHKESGPLQRGKDHCSQEGLLAAHCGTQTRSQVSRHLCHSPVHSIDISAQRTIPYTSHTPNSNCGFVPRAVKRLKAKRW